MFTGTVCRESVQVLNILYAGSDFLLKDIIIPDLRGADENNRWFDDMETYADTKSMITKVENLYKQNIRTPWIFLGDNDKYASSTVFIHLADMF